MHTQGYRGIEDKIESKNTIIMTIGRKYRTIPDILTWDELKEVSDYVRKRCIAQFINIYHRYADRDGDSFKWGDEV